MKKNTRKSLSVRLPLLFVGSVLIIMGVMIPLVYQRFYTRMIDQYTRMAEGATQLMVNAFDGDRTEEYMEKNFSLPEYVETVDYLYTLMDNYPDVLYMYIYRFEKDGGHVIIDLDSDADWVVDPEGYDVGFVWKEMEEPFVSHLDEIMEGKQIAGYSEHSKEDGYLFTYTRPIFRSDGSYACTACVDFSMDYLSNMDISFTLQLSAILLCIGVLVLIFDIYIVRRSITNPINELSECAEKFAYDTEEDRKSNLQLLDAIDIQTGDEIEDVYHTLQNVTRDSFTAAANLSKALEDIQARDGMITAMSADYRSIYYADLDRDECICYRATTKLPEKMWVGKVFSFQNGFTGYANQYIAEKDRDAFLKFIKPENIRAGLAKETMISLRYQSSIDGSEKYEMLRIAAVLNPEERRDQVIRGIAAGFSDVDRQTREELEHSQALKEALSRAEEANAAKTSFLSSMSHEIRTPMNAIIGLDSIALRDTDLPSQTREALEKIGSSARHLLALINDILDMSRIESGRMVLREETFSFREMIDQINTIIKGQCSDKGLDFVFNEKVSLEDCFIGDDLRLRQILINILGNAVKFTDAPGTVTFTVRQDEIGDEKCMLHFTMEDTGIGMEADYIPKLFEAFSQEDATRTNRYGGSGLGMAITKNMVDLMGGVIRVESEKGKGTVFTVDIPLKKAVPAGEKTPQEKPEFSLAGKHALIAEDMELNAEILTDLLEMEEMSCEWAKNGQEAVELFERNEAGHFDVILMDMRMPVMDGLSAAKEIRSLSRPDAKEIPIIALTANAFEEDVRLCIQAGMNAHLSKPVDIELLKDRLSAILSQQEDTERGVLSQR